MRYEHLVIDARECKNNFLDNEEKIRQILDVLSEKLRVNVLRKDVQKYEPQGLTVSYVLAESHMIYHSWPEINAFTLDVFTCGEESPTKIIPDVKEFFKPKEMDLKLITRTLR